MLDVIFASALRNATATSVQINNQSARGILLQWDISAIDGSPPVLTLSIELLDEITGDWVEFEVFSTTQNAVSATQYISRAGQTDTPSGVDEKNDHDLPQGAFRIKVAHSNANDSTYSIAARYFE